MLWVLTGSVLNDFEPSLQSSGGDSLGKVLAKVQLEDMSLDPLHPHEGLEAWLIFVTPVPGRQRHDALWTSQLIQSGRISELWAY